MPAVPFQPYITPRHASDRIRNSCRRRRYSNSARADSVASKYRTLEAHTAGASSTKHPPATTPGPEAHNTPSAAITSRLKSQLGFGVGLGTGVGSGQISFLHGSINAPPCPPA